MMIDWADFAERSAGFALRTGDEKRLRTLGLQVSERRAPDTTLATSSGLEAQIVSRSNPLPEFREILTFSSPSASVQAVMTKTIELGCSGFAGSSGRDERDCGEAAARFKECS